MLFIALGIPLGLALAALGVTPILISFAVMLWTIIGVTMLVNKIEKEVKDAKSK